MEETSFWHITTYIFCIAVVTYMALKLIELVEDKLKFWLKQFKSTESEKPFKSATPVQYNKNYFIYNKSNLNLSNADIVTILNKYFIYYNNLSNQLQQKFYDRLIQFMHTKQFIIHSNEPYKEMPVLISAAAVQISFGLNDFELPHYEYIQVHKEEYFAESSLRILAGNVQGNCITFAWNYLLNGLKDYTDGNNVGLHEMAHALYYQEVMVECNDDDCFEQHFNQLMNNGEIVLQQNQCPYKLYSNYAFTNLQEFWAVSVELFFEKTVELSMYYPKVFDVLQDVLKQNPLNIAEPIL